MKKSFSINGWRSILNINLNWPRLCNDSANRQCVIRCREAWLSTAKFRIQSHTGKFFGLKESVSALEASCCCSVSQQSDFSVSPWKNLLMKNRASNIARLRQNCKSIMFLEKLSPQFVTMNLLKHDFSKNLQKNPSCQTDISHLSWSPHSLQVQCFRLCEDYTHKNNHFVKKILN